ncbi:hypothetical protein BC628DRAFT_670705 [Trametes gibbosa]|nr:hypothetical protein BC628DRAFT_670705 [Trametes gibbosa]
MYNIGQSASAWTPWRSDSTSGFATSRALNTIPRDPPEYLKGLFPHVPLSHHSNNLGKRISVCNRSALHRSTLSGSDRERTSGL